MLQLAPLSPNVKTFKRSNTFCLNENTNIQQQGWHWEHYLFLDFRWTVLFFKAHFDEILLADTSTSIVPVNLKFHPGIFEKPNITGHSISLDEIR